MILLTRRFPNCHWRDLHKDPRFRREVLEPLLAQAIAAPMLMSHLRYKDGHLLYTPGNHLASECGPVECCSLVPTSVDIEFSETGTCCVEMNGSYGLSSTTPGWVAFPTTCGYYHETVFPTGGCDGGECEFYEDQIIGPDPSNIGDAYIWPSYIRIIADNTNSAFYSDVYSMTVDIEIGFARWNQQGVTCTLSFFGFGAQYLFGDEENICGYGALPGGVVSSLWGFMTNCGAPTVYLNAS